MNTYRLKDDERRFLEEVSLGRDGSDLIRLSPGRRNTLQKQFERRGLIADGDLTDSGKKVLRRNPSIPEDEPPTPSEPEYESKGVPEELIDDERQSSDRASDVHRQPTEGMGSTA